MEFFKIKRDLHFMRYAKTTAIISALTFIAALVALGVRGINFGVDFTGGTVIELHYTQTANLPSIRQTLARGGYHDVRVQNFGTSRDVLIRLQLGKNESSAKLSDDVLKVLRRADASVVLRRVEFIGPQVGKELFANGALALLVVSIGIMLYLAVRFEWRFAVGAIIATVHDVVIVLGIFAFFRWEFSLTVLAAILAILGYSVNDTVVVFDRIRENFRKMRKMPVPQLIDNAITRTLSRTIITHLTTQLMVFSMLFLGGQTLFYFALALTIGIIFGTYSSVLVASPIVMWLGISRENFMKSEKKPVDAMP